MNDLIERQKVINVFKILADKMTDEGRTVMEQAISVLRDMSSAESERIAKVKLQDICWEDTMRYKEGMCASCGRSVYDHAKYCDECGCRLEWDE